MEGHSVKDFGTTARGLARNPLGIIALFIVLVYGLASLVVITGPSLGEPEKLTLVYFLVFFPVLVLFVFTWLVAFRSGQLFAPADFKNEENYIEMQRMRYAAIASLAIVKRDDAHISVPSMVKSVETAVNLAKDGSDNPWVLWVDDKPENNIYEREALSSIGVSFILAETTENALEVLDDRTFAAIISDMGRPDSNRAGYILLDTIRERGNRTPLFFYARGGWKPQYQVETLKHGGQGCTNDGQKLFEMITSTVFAGRSTNNRLAA